MNRRLTGIVINQDDLPYWCVDILHWLGMVHAMQQASGEIGNTYRRLLEEALETGAPVMYVNTKTKDARKRTRWLSGPASIYAVYQDFCTAVETEASK